MYSEPYLSFVHAFMLFCMVPSSTPSRGKKLSLVDGCLVNTQTRWPQTTGINHTCIVLLLCNSACQFDPQKSCSHAFIWLCVFPLVPAELTPLYAFMDFPKLHATALPFTAIFLQNCAFFLIASRQLLLNTDLHPLILSSWSLHTVITQVVFSPCRTSSP